KRRAKEAEVAARSPTSEDAWADLRPVLDLELERLPEKYRAALVLCDLEGKSRKEAARHLRWPEGTVASRLAAARVLLAKRLARHRLSVSGGALALILSEKGSACVPAALLSSTFQSASVLGTGGGMGMLSVHVAALTQGVLKTMLMTKLKAVTAM